MKMTRRIREDWGRGLALIVMTTAALAVACKSSKSDDGAPPTDTAKASTAARVGSDSVRGGSLPVASRTGAHTVVFIGTSLTAGLGLNPDSAYPQLIQQKIEDAHMPFDVVNAGVSGETTAGL